MKKKIITASIITVLGICAILAGLFVRSLTPSDDVSTFTDETVGKTVHIRANEDNLSPFVVYSEDTGKFSYDYNKWVFSCDDDTYMRIIMPYNISKKFDSNTLGNFTVTLTGTVGKTPDWMKEETESFMISYMESLAKTMDGYEVTEEEKDLIRSSISVYFVEVTSTDAETIKIVRTVALILGTVLLIAALILWISIISRQSVLKIALIIVVIVPVTAFIIFAILFNRQFGAMCNIRKDDVGVYYMEYKGQLKLDDMLAANITSDPELLDWISRAEYHGLCPITLDSGRYACSSFSAKTPEGDVLFGRNFEYPETDAVMIYMDPPDGYASYAMADLAVLGIGRGTDEIDPDSPLGRFMMAATPYVVLDGVNEKGLGVSTLELAIGELHQNGYKDDLFIYTAIRVLLDRCATVDDAVALLGNYDIHTHNNVSQHLFIADKSGRSVVVEWMDDEMYVNELNAVTNSVVTPGDRFDEEADWRLPVLQKKLALANNTLTAEQARDLLDDVSQANFTQWSSVYNLSKFSADVYMDENYSKAYHYGK
ncbi:MAG: linear amide C-N hydrolase [Clostridiales bacterium]|nr:linear amide C-N hydrolase [Clostridiales bacterium]